ncbi:MAG TPA: hypothetical protein VGB85_30070 [Nannocystis sp.]
MQPRALLGIAAALGVAYATYAWTRPPADLPADLPAGAAEAAIHRPPPAAHDVLDEQDHRAVASALQRAFGPPPEPELKLPPARSRREAEASFEGMMTALEELADAGKKLPRARRDQLYRDTNDVFSALSAHLDPNDAADMQLLEDANIRMKAMLGELGVRVPRRLAPAE